MKKSFGSLNIIPSSLSEEFSTEAIIIMRLELQHMIKEKKYKFSDSGFLNVNIFWFLFNYSKPNIFGSWRQQDISGGPAGLWDTVINFFHLL